LRLAVVSPFVDRQHGTERALAELLERLADSYGCEIHLFAQQVEGLALSSPGSVKSGSAGAIIWHRVPRLPGPHILQFLAWFYLNRIWRFAFSAFGGVSFDLVLSPGINCSDARVILVHALFHRLKELSDDARTSSIQAYSFLTRLHRRAYYKLMTRLERQIYSDPNVLLAAVSTRTATLLQKYFHRDNVAVVPNGVNTRSFSPAARDARRIEARRHFGYGQEEFVLLLLGNDWSVKGLPAILSVVAGCTSLPLRVLAAGSDLAGPHQAQARQLGILDRCTWASPNPDVLSFYAAADVYVSPSLEDSFGLPVAEAMACGLPAITSRFAGIAELVESDVDGFVLNDPKDSGELARLLEELFQDPARRQRVGEAAARKALEWTWDRNAAAIWELLKQAVAPHAKSV
jgi:glycosyltransferase involved in cell wall biosynthesis